MAYREAAVRPRQAGARSHSPYRPGQPRGASPRPIGASGCCGAHCDAAATDIDRVLSRSSPRARDFLNAMSDQARRRLIDSLERQLSGDGSLLVVKRENELPLIARRAADGIPAQPDLCLTDLYDFPVPDEDVLRAAFGLTPAEARLARGIARGDALEEVATALGIRMPTARSQLAAVFAKTGTRRQARLVAILALLALLAA